MTAMLTLNALRTNARLSWICARLRLQPDDDTLRSYLTARVEQMEADGGMWLGDRPTFNDTGTMSKHALHAVSRAKGNDSADVL